MGSLQRILGDLRKGGEGEDALRDFVELEARVLPFFSAAVALKPAAVSCQSNTSQRNIVVGALSCDILYLRTQ